MLTPLAGFRVQARLLSRRNYGFGPDAVASPTDFALGWGPMRDGAVLSLLSISPSGRRYRQRWHGEPPLPPAEIACSSANMHVIPSNAQAAAGLRKTRRDDNLRIDGWRVRADAAGRMALDQFAQARRQQCGRRRTRLRLPHRAPATAAQAAVPIGQLTPVPPSPQYPVGCFDRYCWCSSSA